jgi:hypothetical protein
MRGTGDRHDQRMAGAITLNGAFVNLTLFEQAHVPLAAEGATG